VASVITLLLRVFVLLPLRRWKAVHMYFQY
jgi:hypothetical protein